MTLRVGDKSFDWLLERVDEEGARMVAEGTNFFGEKWRIVCTPLIQKLSDDALLRASRYFERITMNDVAVVAAAELIAEIERRARKKSAAEWRVMRLTLYASLVAAVAGIVAAVTPFLHK